MSPNQVEKLDKFLSASFGEGVYSCELRLSGEELEYVRKKYPRASVKKCLASQTRDGKCWYEVNLTVPVSFAEPAPESEELAAIHQENHRLRMELEMLKKTMKFA